MSDLNLGIVTALRVLLILSLFASRKFRSLLAVFPAK